MPEIELTLPAEAPVELGFVADQLPGRPTVNAALRHFEPRQVFRWQLSVWIECQALTPTRLPTAEEQQVLRELEQSLHQALAADGNALFAARLSHDGGREVLWRVHQPQAARALLEHLAATPDLPRQFSWRLDDDPAWARLAEYLEAAGTVV